MDTMVFERTIKNDKLTASRKREQVIFSFSGFQFEDGATKSDAQSLLRAVKDAGDWAEKASAGSAHEWKAKHAAPLPLMWRWRTDVNFGVTVQGKRLVMPPFLIHSDRDTLVMVRLGQLESILTAAIAVL